MAQKSTMIVSSPEEVSAVLQSGCGCEQAKDRGRGGVGERGGSERGMERGREQGRELGGGSTEVLGGGLVHPVCRQQENEQNRWQGR